MLAGQGSDFFLFTIQRMIYAKTKQLRPMMMSFVGFIVVKYD
jgi:hypothetical protein